LAVGRPEPRPLKDGLIPMALGDDSRDSPAGDELIHWREEDSRHGISSVPAG
jgi:hypothetical protein